MNANQLSEKRKAHSHAPTTTLQHQEGATYINARRVPNDVHQAGPPPAVLGKLGQRGPMGQVCVRVDSGFRTVEHRLHLGVLLHPSVEPLVVVAILLVADDCRHLDQGVVGVFAGDEEHLSFPQALQVACIDADELQHTKWSAGVGVWGAPFPIVQKLDTQQAR